MVGVGAMRGGGVCLNLPQQGIWQFLGKERSGVTKIGEGLGDSAIDDPISLLDIQSLPTYHDIIG